MARTNVISLDMALKITRANTLRSSSYEKKAARLSPLQKRLLNLLEERLFISRDGLEVCQSGKLQKLEGHFVCAEGQIWFYFSRPKRKFVLLDFEFDEGGSGGLPVPVIPKTCSAASVSCGRRTASSSRRSAQKVASASSAKLSSVLRTVLEFATIIYIFSGLTSRRGISTCAGLISLDIKHFSIEDFDMSCQKYSPAQHEFVLPEWSILHDFVATPEQLRNDYARSILTGEALCRAATQSTFGKRLLSRVIAGSYPIADLLDESSSVLNMIFEGKSPKHAGLRHLKLTRTMDANLLADDDLLSVARSELTAYMSIYVASIAADHANSNASNNRRRKHIATSKIMKKYALLAEFCWLSQTLFDVDYICEQNNSFWEHQRFDILRDIAFKKLHDFGRLDLSAHFVFSEHESETFGDDVDRDDLGLLHSRLINLTRELLTPLN